MKKLKIYLDTSVISHLQHEDAPDKMADTLRLWEEIKAGLYEVSISRVTLDEIMAAPEKRQLTMLKHLSEIAYDLLEEKPEIQLLANAYINSGILKQKSMDDCMHLAFATIYECDFIASWNFKHIVNVRTISGVNDVNVKNGYNEMKIVSPIMIIEGGD